MRQSFEGRKLDNAANLFPAIATRQDPHVYRLTAILQGQIHRDVLQKALDQTLPYFKAFDVSLYSGWFRSLPEAIPTTVFIEKNAGAMYVNLAGVMQSKQSMPV